MEAAQYFGTFFDFYCPYRIAGRKIAGKRFQIIKRKHRLMILKSVVLLVVCMLGAFLGPAYAADFIHNRSCINRIINWLCLGIALVTNFMVTWESMATSKEDIRVWNTFDQIERTLFKDDRDGALSLLHRASRSYGFMFFLWLAQIGFVIGLLVVLEMHSEEHRLRYFIIIFEVLSLVDSMKLLQIIMYCRILTVYVRLLTSRLGGLVASINGIVEDRVPDRFHQQFQLLSLCYFNCMKVFCQMQDQFGWTLTFMCIKYFIVLWNEIYWAVYRSVLDRSFEWYCVNLVPYHFVYVLFTWSCERFYTEIRALSRQIYMVNMNALEETFVLRIRQFQLLLDYNDLFFHTFGVCLVSYRLIFQFVISAITRVSFMAQILIDFSYD
uniref:Gustatory receptor n=2 Tax=Anopheles albimanus TaxID=7167 RepID=A0A182FZM7_ANOAL